MEDSKMELTEDLIRELESTELESTELESTELESTELESTELEATELEATELEATESEESVGMTVEDWLGKDNVFGQNIWKNKYQRNNESFEQWLERVSGGYEEIRMQN